MTPITYMQDLVKHLPIKIKIIFDKGMARFANNAINSCLFYPTLESLWNFQLGVNMPTGRQAC